MYLYSSEDKYWEYDKIEKNYKLHFRRFYEDEIIATILQDEDDGEEYYFNFKPKYCPNCGSKIID